MCQLCLPGGAELVHLTECDSTNSEALRLVLAGAALPIWVVADRQTAGKGRSGRSWASSSGNLLASMGLELRTPLARAPELSLVAGVAAIDALRRAVPSVPARLKWPNDVLIGEAKVGGILVESTTIGERLVAIVGVGLNLQSYPPAIGRAATSISEHMPHSDVAPAPLEMLAFLAEAMHDWLLRWELGFEPIRHAWLAAAGDVGERLTVNAGAGPVEGAFAGIDEGGALLLHVAGGDIVRFTFGDVTLDPKA